MARGPGLAHVKLGVWAKGPKGPKGIQETNIYKGQGSQRGQKRGPKTYIYIHLICKLGVECVNELINMN